MNWNEIVGQDSVKRQLIESVDYNRIAQTQLFVGEDGYGTLPLVLAYTQAILGRKKESSIQKIQNFNHLDVHFIFPVFSRNKEVKCSYFLAEWRNMMMKNPYSDYYDWVEQLEAENKQFFIFVDEILDKIEHFNLKSFEGGIKILVIWQADKMREDAANKFLKFLEEPPEKTFIFLTTSRKDLILPTILSRCQIVEVPRISEEDLRKKIISTEKVNEEQLRLILQQADGNYHRVLELLSYDKTEDEFEVLFIEWVRLAFMAKKNLQALQKLFFWARNIAEWNREKQKKFLEYCLNIFRSALFQNYGIEQLAYDKIKEAKFNWSSFSEFITGSNIEEILQEITESDYHLTRNANSKLLWTDMSIKLTRLIHKK